MTAALFDGSYEGFLTVVHASYYQRLDWSNIQWEGAYQQSLDEEPYFIPSDNAKALAVMKALRQKISPAAESNTYHAFLADGEDRCLDLYKYIRLGFRVGPELDAHMQEPFVRAVQKRAAAASREAQHLSGFCRFALTEQNVYYASISPVHDVLAILAEHFKDRLMDQLWILHDQKRGTAAIYNGHDYSIEAVGSAKIIYAPEEACFQDLWKAFFNTIAVEGRINKKLQRNLLPLRYRSHMTEFQGGN